MTHILIAMDDVSDRNIHRIATAAEGWATYELIHLSTPPGEYRQKLAGADIVIGWPEAQWLLDSRVSLALVPSHGFESYEGRGLENKPGFRLCNARGAYSVAVAEHCIALILALARKLHLHALDQRERHWNHRAPYREITGSKACIVGLGSVGREIAARCAGLGMHVAGVDVADIAAPPGVNHLYKSSELGRALADADHAIAIVPGGASNTAMFSGAFFATMKRGAYFYNVGRGASVDEAALVAALQSGHLGGAGLDVFGEEPLSADSPLWGFENVLITPHVAGNSVNWDTRLTDQIVENLARFRDESPLVNQVIPRP